jgi:glycosyltransferase involved in cell wall biosynthesis
MNDNKSLFIVVPSNSPTGPIKGAFAVANGLASAYDVTIVFLKRSKSHIESPHSGVKQFYLNAKNPLLGFFGLRRLIKSQGGRSNCAVISMCLSADLTCLPLKGIARVYPSVRGNLYSNYYYDYGLLGILAAFFHLACLNIADGVISMSNAMKIQLSRVIRFSPIFVVPNFIDETQCLASSSSASSFPSKNPPNRLDILFLGSLSARKNPALVINAIASLPKEYNVFLHVVGTGPLLPSLDRLSADLNLKEKIIFYGHVSNPLPIVRQSDILVLPSYSEGISRASLEALFLGTYCILRNVDGNSELITSAKAGSLLNNDCNLSFAIIQALPYLAKPSKKTCLLPDQFRQANCISRLKQILL